MSNRSRELDYIKASMAILIVLYHYTTRYAEMLNKTPFPVRISNGGTIGVAIFFIISAIFAVQGCETKKEGLVFYMTERIIRLYPAYVASIFIIFTVTSLYPIPELSIDKFSFIANIFLLQRFTGIEAVDGAHWYIAFLLVMYFWIAIIYKIGAHKFATTYTVWLIVSTLFSSDFYAFFGIKMQVVFGNKFNALMNIITLERYSSYVIMGAMCYFIAQKFEYKWILVLGACFLRTIVYIGTLNACIVFILMLLVFFSYNGKLHFKRVYVLDYISSISYSLYLIHQNIGYVILDILDKHGFSQEYAILVPLVVSIVLASIIAFFVEKPARIYFKSKRQQLILKARK